MKNIFNASRKIKSCLFFSLILISLINVDRAAAQSRSSLGFRLGANKPFADAYKFGIGGALQANIAFDNKWGFEPSLGYDRLNGNNYTWVTSTGPIFFQQAESLYLIHLDLAAKYYVIPNFFVRLGPVLYLAGSNEDLKGLGVGGTAALGYQLMLDKRNKLEFVFNTDLIKVERGFGDGLVPFAGLKVAYAFNFSGN